MSTRTRSRATKAVAAGLVLTLTQVLLGGGFARAASKAAPTGAAAAMRATPAAGRLATRGNGAVTLNGNPARTGETVFSGQQIHTPEGVGASVHLGGLGRVDIAPGATLTLNFGEARLAARVAGGCAVVTPGEGVEGVMETKATAEKSVSAPIDMCVDPVDGVALKGAAAEAGAGAVAPEPQGSGGGGRLGTGRAIFITAASVAGFALLANRVINPPCRRGRNPSPGEPRGRNDECR